MYAQFSVIIPTLWLSEKLRPMLDIYAKCKDIAEIIIINNNTAQTPDYIKDFPKVKLINLKSNIYVNPAWNLGASIAAHNILTFTQFLYTTKKM